MGNLPSGIARMVILTVPKKILVLQQKSYEFIVQDYYLFLLYTSILVKMLHPREMLKLRSHMRTILPLTENICQEIHIYRGICCAQLQRALEPDLLTGYVVLLATVDQGIDRYTEFCKYYFFTLKQKGFFFLQVFLLGIIPLSFLLEGKWYTYDLFF